jgi:hypothetical protein
LDIQYPSTTFAGNMNRNAHYIWGTILIVALIVEVAMQTFCLNCFGYFISPVISITAGLLVGISALMIADNQLTRTANIDKAKFVVPKWRYTLLGISFASAAILCGVLLSNIMEAFPVDASSSDIIPSLEMYVRRLLAGEVVYRPLPFDGYEVDPTYYPLLWGPYIFSEILNIDYRWTAYGVFLLALFWYQYRLVRQNIHTAELVIKMLIPFLWIFLFTQSKPGTFGLAVELLPIGFYLFLGLTIFHQRPWVMALGILLCLLSRYAFTFWLPMYMLILWFERGFKTVFRTSLWVAGGVLLLYIIPFLSKDWTIISKGLEYYKKTAVGQWQTQPWQAPGAAPHHLSNGLSMAMYFYDYEEYTVEDRLTYNRKVHLAVCTAAALFILFGYFFFRKGGMDPRFYLLAALKIYLVLFYGFFYVPFGYLFQLPLFMSIPLVYSIPFLKRLKT